MIRWTPARPRPWRGGPLHFLINERLIGRHLEGNLFLRLRVESEREEMQTKRLEDVAGGCRTPHSPRRLTDEHPRCTELVSFRLIPPTGRGDRVERQMKVPAECQ
jgi:hypothetical protein